MRAVSKGIIATVIFFALASPVAAGWPWNADNKVRQEERKETKLNLRETIQTELRNKFGSFPGVLKNRLRQKFSFGSGLLTAINGTTLTVEKDGKSYTVLTGTFEHCKTKFQRRFWGSSSISEMTIGDKLNVIGRWQDDAKTIIEACSIRDVSIQKRFGVFLGVVTSVTPDGWVMTTFSAKRPDQSVFVSASTKFVNRKNETITKADVVVGHRVRVKGMWNNTNNTITDVTHVKDFSLPPWPFVTPTAIPVVTSTPIPTAVPTATPIPTESPTLTPTP